MRWALRCRLIWLRYRAYLSWLLLASAAAFLGLAQLTKQLQNQSDKGMHLGRRCLACIVHLMSHGSNA